MLSSGFHTRAWAAIVKQAGLESRRFKDLRDTFVSQLVSAGVPLAYVSKQLGHADVAVTAKHYSKWCGGDEYRDPVRLLPGEVPADLLARIALVCEGRHPNSDPTTGTAEGTSSGNPRPFGDFLEHETGLEPATPTLATWRSTN